jgi:hypothetical protein
MLGSLIAETRASIPRIAGTFSFGYKNSLSCTLNLAFSFLMKVVRVVVKLWVQAEKFNSKVRICLWV